MLAELEWEWASDDLYNELGNAPYYQIKEYDKHQVLNKKDAIEVLDELQGKDNYILEEYEITDIEAIERYLR